jgi:N-acetylglutamate synthase-like GNAT family acetyltransferase
MSEATFRLANVEDIPAIEQLIALSARGLCVSKYSAAQVEAALGTAWGCDSELIRDGTYFVAEVAGELVACGGWGRRRTLFGGDAQPGRVSDLLNPHQDAARIRAFFVRPDWARRGLGRQILERCESEAQAHGFRAVELLATLTGERFYQRFGYTGEATVEYPIPGGEVIRFVPMRKPLG